MVPDEAARVAGDVHAQALVAPEPGMSLPHADSLLLLCGGMRKPMAGRGEDAVRDGGGNLVVGHVEEAAAESGVVESVAC